MSCWWVLLGLWCWTLTLLLVNENQHIQVALSMATLCARHILMSTRQGPGLKAWHVPPCLALWSPFWLQKINVVSFESLKRRSSSAVTFRSCGSESSFWSWQWAEEFNSLLRCPCPGSWQTTSWKPKKRQWWSKCSGGLSQPPVHNVYSPWWCLGGGGGADCSHCFIWSHDSWGETSEINTRNRCLGFGLKSGAQAVKLMNKFSVSRCLQGPGNLARGEVAWPVVWHGLRPRWIWERKCLVWGSGSGLGVRDYEGVRKYEIHGGKVTANRVSCGEQMGSPPGRPPCPPGLCTPGEQPSLPLQQQWHPQHEVLMNLCALWGLRWACCSCASSSQWDLTSADCCCCYCC